MHQGAFQHFHISQQLIAGVDVFLLAKNTSTSSDVIERFYGQVSWSAWPRSSGRSGARLAEGRPRRSNSG